MRLSFISAFLKADDRPKRDMLARSVRPEDLEIPLSGFSDYLTPFEHFFVRTHVYVPTVDVHEWRLKTEGEVAAPLTFTLDELKKLPAMELVSVVEWIPYRASRVSWAQELQRLSNTLSNTLLARSVRKCIIQCPPPEPRRPARPLVAPPAGGSRCRHRPGTPRTRTGAAASPESVPR